MPAGLRTFGPFIINVRAMATDPHAESSPNVPTPTDHQPTDGPAAGGSPVPATHNPAEPPPEQDGESTARDIAQDFLTGVFSLERSLVKTVRALFTQPEAPIRAYLTKKKDYFGPFKYVFLTATLSVLCMSLFVDFDQMMAETVAEESRWLGSDSSEEVKATQRAAVVKMGRIMQQYMPLILIIFYVPALSLAAKWVFHRRLPKFLHHFVAYTYIVGHYSLMSLLLLPLLLWQKNIFGPYMVATMVLLFAYTVWVYRRLLSLNSVGGTLRIVASVALGLLIYMVGSMLLGLLIGIIVGVSKAMSGGAAAAALPGLPFV